MKQLTGIILTVLGSALMLVSCTSATSEEPSLKDALDGKFYIGAALNGSQILGEDSASVEIIRKHFNTITAENCMKSGPVHPREDEYDFDLADKFVSFGEENGMYIVGHCLIWHSQAPRWLFVDEDGNDVGSEVLTERMREHITTVVTRYKGKVDAWDVVNEAINDDGSWRENKFYQILGKDYVKLAFQFANEADPDAELLYNDYSMAHEGRRNGVLQMAKEIQEAGIRIDGIGMQAHCQMDFPPVDEFEKSIEAFAALGLDVHITEMDITILPPPRWDVGADVRASFEYQEKMNPYTQGLPDSARIALHDRYMDFFNLFLKHQDKIKRVTMWGVTDQQSWKNDWPIRGRTDYPLLFDRENQPKDIVADIIKAAEGKVEE